MNQCVVSLGSNIEPQAHMLAAVDLLAREFKLITRSSFVITKPLGVIDQADFLNGVILLSTHFDQPEFSSRLKELEVIIGRKPGTDKWGPREIDLDVLLWNGQVVSNDFYDRDFLRKAVAEVLPSLSSRCY